MDKCYLDAYTHNLVCTRFERNRVKADINGIDCERSTIDEECLESMRSYLPKPHALEYMIFGKFKIQAGGSSFKDTYFFYYAARAEGGGLNQAPNQARPGGVRGAAGCCGMRGDGGYLFGRRGRRRGGGEG